MLIPLYLLPEVETNVSLDEKSLLIKQDAQAVQRVPLSRLSRVISTCRAHWAQAALLACMEAGIPVFFMNAQGSFMGVCYGSRRRESMLGNLLMIAVDEPEWPAELTTWFQAMHKNECNETQRLLGIRSRNRALTGVHSSAMNVLYQCWRVAPAPFVRAYVAVLRPWVEQQLLNELGGYEHLAWPAEGVHLAERFTQLLIWQQFQLLNTVACKPGANQATAQWAVLSFEKNLPVIGKRFGGHLGRFESWLRMRY